LNSSEFIAKVAPYAVELRLEGSPLFPSVRIAQCALETGWKIPPWNNLGGIKVGSGKPNPWWDGSSVNRDTWEVINGQTEQTSAYFRAYPSIYHFFKDQDLLFQLPRYERVRQAKTPEEQCAMLQACGYATDPEYARKLNNLIRSFQLKRYDQEVEDVLKKIDELIQANKRLEERIARLEPKKPEEQVVAPWAQPGYKFVTAKRNGETISDGKRPRDPVTRQEVWAMFERYDRLINKEQK
jgi:hypothetical protein